MCCSCHLSHRADLVLLSICRHHPGGWGVLSEEALPRCLHTAEHRVARDAKRRSRRGADRCDRCPWAPSHTPDTGRARRGRLSVDGTPPAHTSDSVNALRSDCLPAACFHGLLSILSWPCLLPSVAPLNLEVFEIMIYQQGNRLCAHTTWVTVSLSSKNVRSMSLS